MKYPHIFTLLAALAFPSLANAQDITGQSPLSRYGLGTIFGYGLSRNEAMAGSGISVPSQDHINLINPALLPYTEKVNMNIDLRYQYRNLEVGNAYQYNGGAGGPAIFAISLPVHRKVTIAFGIRPNSSREFIFSQKKNVGGDSIQYISHGAGGTSKAFLSAGIRLSSRLTVGLETGYVFGTLEDSLKFGNLPISSNFEFITITKKRYSQVVFKPGLSYRYPIRENTYLAFGASADLTGKFTYRTYQTFTIRGAGATAETLADGTKNTLTQPTTYSFGVGYYRPMEWSANAEFDFVDANGATDNGSSLAYKNGWSVRAGGEISPGTKKSTRYFNVITFRGGVAYSLLPQVIEGKSITEQKVSIGASFPIIRKEAKFTRPLINLAVAYGQRGNADVSIGKEKFWMVTVGFTLNDFLWFNRYRID